MSLFQFLEFILKFNESSSNPFNFGLSFCVFLFTFWGIGSIWGKLWNKEWSLISFWTVMLWVIGFGVVAGYSTMTLLKLSSMQNWFEQRNREISYEILDGKFNRNVTCKALGPLTSGNSFPLESSEDAYKLAKVTAKGTLTQLKDLSPFKEGVSLPLKDNSSSIASKVMNLVPFTQTQEISPNNKWVDAAVQIQVNRAMSKGWDQVFPHIHHFTIIFTALLALSILLPLTFVPWIAYADIKENPEP